MAETVKHFDLNFFVDKEKGRFLFAEADGDFVNVLFSILTLPLLTIVRVIGKTHSETTSTVGCFPILYQTVSSVDLGDEFFQLEKMLDVMVLHPHMVYEDMCRRLKISMNDANAKVFSSKALKYIISDNLQVTPVFRGTFIGYLSNLGTDSSMIEERTVKLGASELVELLKAIVLSRTPFTDLFVAKTKPRLSSVPKQVFLQKTPSGGGRKITVKVVLKKSSKEFLFVESGNDFIDFLSGLLFISLGQMVRVSEGQSGLGCIDGLYKSAQSLHSQPFSSEYIDEVAGSGASVREEAVFIVLDNLTVKPFSAAAAMSIIKMHKVSFSDLEERTLSVGIAECISILKASLYSTTAISNGLLHNSLVLQEPKQEK